MFINFIKNVAICLLAISVCAVVLNMIDDGLQDEQLSAQVLDETIAQSQAEHQQKQHIHKKLHAMQIEANQQLGLK